jgi:hypothetical protein
MTHSRFMSSRLVVVLSLAAPVAITQGARLVLEAGPQAADASMVTEISPAIENSQPAATVVKLTAEQQRLAAYLAARPAIDPVASPMYRVPAEQGAHEPAQPVRIATQPAPTELADPSTAVVLTSVLGEKQHSRAVINGRLHKVGDTVCKGWKLVLIDGRNRGIVVQSLSGRTQSIQVPSR